MQTIIGIKAYYIYYYDVNPGLIRVQTIIR